MKALQFVAEHQAEVADLPIPAIGSDEVLIAARSVGVCHSDIELLEGRYIIPFSYPIIPGHEWSGEVVRVGERVTDFAPGDRVVGECVIGDDHFGFSISGAAAEFFVARPEWLHRLPDAVDNTNGALVEPFTVAYHSLMEIGNVNASDTVAVLGAGPVGLAVIAGARGLGATVVSIEPGAHRRAAAIAIGADHAVDPDEAESLLAGLTEGRGPSVVIEVSGRPAVMARALELAAVGARVGFIGIDVGAEAPAKLGLIQSKALRIVGTIGSPGVWSEALRFLARTGIDLSPLVTSRFTADAALDALEAAQTPATTIKAHIQYTATL